MVFRGLLLNDLINTELFYSFSLWVLILIDTYSRGVSLVRDSKSIVSMSSFSLSAVISSAVLSVFLFFLYLVKQAANVAATAPTAPAAAVKAIIFLEFLAI